MLDLSVQFFFSAIEAATACDLIEPFSKNKNGRLELCNSQEPLDNHLLPHKTFLTFAALAARTTKILKAETASRGRLLLCAATSGFGTSRTWRDVRLESVYALNGRRSLASHCGSLATAAPP